MPKAVIAGYSRSPFTIANKGELVSVRPEDLLSEVIKELVNQKLILKILRILLLDALFQKESKVLILEKLSHIWQV